MPLGKWYDGCKIVLVEESNPSRLHDRQDLYPLYYWGFESWVIWIVSISDTNFPLEWSYSADWTVHNCTRTHKEKNKYFLAHCSINSNNSRTFIIHFDWRFWFVSVISFGKKKREMSDYITCYSNEFNPGWKQILMTGYDIVLNIQVVNYSVAQMVERSIIMQDVHGSTPCCSSFYFHISFYRLDLITKNLSRLEWELNLGLPRNRRQRIPLYHVVETKLGSKSCIRHLFFW